MAQRHVVQGRAGERALHEDGVSAQEHGLLGAGARSVERYVGGEHGGYGRVEGVEPVGEKVGDPLLDLAVDVVYGEAAGLLSREVCTAPDPGQREDLQGAGAGVDYAGLQAFGGGDVGHGKRGEDVECAGASGDVGHVVVADEQEHGDAGLRETSDAPGELALVGLRGVAALVGVAGEQGEVDAAVDGVVDELVECVEEVTEARAQAGGRVGVAVALDADVHVREVEDTHGYRASHSSRLMPACRRMRVRSARPTSPLCGLGTRTRVWLRIITWCCPAGNGPSKPARRRAAMSSRLDIGPKRGN